MNELPLFYRQPVAFDVNLHGHLQFAERNPEFGFAAKASVIALVVSEVAQAVRHYPLVFFVGEGNAAPVLAALVGLDDGINRFVDSQKQWRAGTYIPAYVRRYPFLSVNVAGQVDSILAIDTSQAWIQEPGGEAFVDATGQATPRLARVLAFQRDYQQQADITQRMCVALIAAGVLEPRVLTWQGTDGSAHRLDGFWGVEESRLKALSPDALIALHQADALGLAYAQLLSMSNLQGLVDAGVPAPV